MKSFSEMVNEACAATVSHYTHDATKGFIHSCVLHVLHPGKSSIPYVDLDREVELDFVAVNAADDAAGAVRVATTYAATRLTISF